MAKGKKTDEIARLGQQLVIVSEKAGQWIDEVFGEGARQFGAAFADSMSGLRVRNRLRVLQKTHKALEDAGISGNTRPLGERMMLPIWEAIGEEVDETLQDIWAIYIRNAVDPKRPTPDKILIDIIRKLEPSDWPFLKKLFSLSSGTYNEDTFDATAESLSDTFDRLSFLGLLVFDDERSPYLVMGSPAKLLTIKIGAGTYYESRILRKLADAISSEGDQSNKANSVRSA